MVLLHQRCPADQPLQLLLWLAQASRCCRAALLLLGVRSAPCVRHCQ